MNCDIVCQKLLIVLTILISILVELMICQIINRTVKNEERKTSLTISNQSRGRYISANFPAFVMPVKSSNTMFIWILVLTSKGRPDSDWIQMLWMIINITLRVNKLVASVTRLFSAPLKASVEAMRKRSRTVANQGVM